MYISETNGQEKNQWGNQLIKVHQENSIYNSVTVTTLSQLDFNCTLWFSEI